MRENSTSRLECISDSNPRPSTFRWSLGDKRTENRLLDLTSVTNRTSGMYTCSVSVTSRGGFTISDGMKSVRIKVQCKIDLYIQYLKSFCLSLVLFTLAWLSMFCFIRFASVPKISTTECDRRRIPHIVLYGLCSP